MRVAQAKWTAAAGWTPAPPHRNGDDDQLVLIFGSTALLKDAARLREIRDAHPSAHLFGCSTAGEICGTSVADDSLVATAVRFDHTRLEAARVRLGDAAGSLDAGRRLARALDPRDLVHVFVISDGLKINGSELVAGLRAHLPEGVAVTGGLSGDGARFAETFVLLDGAPEEGLVAALGFYGTRLQVGYGSLGGWDPFGPERLITRSKGNILYELDGQSALGLYKKYLGEYASGLPATGLLFPLSLRRSDDEPPVVRTMLAISEADQGITFAGDLPEGARARLMKANFERLIDGATGAAHATRARVASSDPELAVLISCVGRKLILKQRIEEEVEGVRDVLGARAVLAGFYSYGEICPVTPSARCELHNQTMTITTFSEK